MFILRTIFIILLFTVIVIYIPKAIRKRSRKSHRSGNRDQCGTSSRSTHTQRMQYTRQTQDCDVDDKIVRSNNEIYQTGKKYIVDEETAIKYGVTSQMLKDTLIEGEKRIREMRKYQKKIKNSEVKTKIDKLCDVIKKIFVNFVKDPKDIKTARQFLNYYLEATLKILKNYTEISSAGAVNSEIQTSLKKAESMLDMIEKAFNKQLAKLQENDVMDLNVEMDVLEKTLKMEGF